MKHKTPHAGNSALDITGQDHVQGAVNAAVTLVEYGDFECPYSRLAAHTVKKLQQQFGNELRFVFRHFPLTAKHPHALIASEAAEAAASERRFWLMYDLLFDSQDRLERSDLMEYAGQLELDPKRFDRALTEHRYLDRVKTDVASGKQHGVDGTPTFFINGRRQDEDDLPKLQAAIRQALHNQYGIQ
ncbi:DSBA oxidoreductase [Nitrospira sp. KM1]|uniref:DsbA family protein n=1 Tax=Nitrospira sp. KM1 TaxID=1936990 RepID=UPI0013A71E6F|nr:thioredoxin domain-containing protein [Nitrospira sp. KM1]BCA53795.1 DSBA oxidoreductase [Nitrospira sp. KM1]